MCPAQVLVISAILCQASRTVATALPMTGLGQEPRFEHYHQMLNRAHGSEWTLRAHQYYSSSADANDSILFPQAPWETVLDQLAATT